MQKVLLKSRSENIACAQVCRNHQRKGLIECQPCFHPLRFRLWAAFEDFQFILKQLVHSQLVSESTAKDES